MWIKWLIRRYLVNRTRIKSWWLWLKFFHFHKITCLTLKETGYISIQRSLRKLNSLKTGLNVSWVSIFPLSHNKNSSESWKSDTDNQYLTFFNVNWFLKIKRATSWQVFLFWWNFIQAGSVKVEGVGMQFCPSSVDHCFITKAAHTLVCTSPTSTRFLFLNFCFFICFSFASVRLGFLVLCLDFEYDFLMLWYSH